LFFCFTSRILTVVTLIGRLPLSSLYMVRPGSVSGNFAVSVCAFAERESAAVQEFPVPKSDPTRPKINWNDLRHVLAVGRAGTLAGAARALGVNETTVGRRIAAIEEALGVRLFDKVQRGKLPPTKAGAEAIAQSELIEQRVLDLRNEIAGGDREVAGMVRLTAVPILVNRLLVPASRALLDRCPQLRVEIVADFRNLSLVKREADIAVRLAAPKKGAGNAVLARKIGLLKYDVYAASSLDIQSASGLPWITYESTMGHIPQAKWLSEEIDRRSESVAGFSFNDAEGLMHAVRAGLGKSLLPCMVADADPRLRRVAGISSGQSHCREVWVLTHPDQRSLARIDTVIDWLESIFRSREASACAG
jgi:DNA-binding transcriptional LysR family regulator